MVLCFEPSWTHKEMSVGSCFVIPLVSNVPVRRPDVCLYGSTAFCTFFLQESMTPAWAWDLRFDMWRPFMSAG
jgi:hypothetical protein